MMSSSAPEPCDRTPDRALDRPWTTRLAPPTWIALVALGVVLLAWVQPVSYMDADGAVTLLSAQAIVDHGVPHVDVYRGHPSLAYELQKDYRLRPRGDHLHLYNVGMQWLSVPVVAISRALGYDMLKIEHEHGLQNLLSALSAGLIFMLIVSIARLTLPLAPSLLLAMLWVLGSPLISTVATGLWSLDYAAVLLLVAVREIAWVEAGRRERPRWWLLVPVLVLAYACRPASGFMAVGVAAWVVARWRSPGRIRLILGALAAGLAVFALPDGVLPEYYDPDRLKLVTPIGEGLVGVLLSPARGLLLFCPFLIVVAGGALRLGRRFWTTPVAALVMAWSLPHLFFVATKGVWWGGHCFGPRMLAELMLPALLVAVRLEREAWWRRPWLRAALIATGVAAIAIHSGSGLFNNATRLWNGRPNVDHSARLLRHWRDPQFLATESSLDARELFWQRYILRPLHVGDRLLPEEDQAVFIGFGAPEASGRWTLAPQAGVEFAIGGIRPDDWYLLELALATNGPQTVQPTLNGNALMPWTVDGFSPRTIRLPLAGHALMPRPGSPRSTLNFALPDARVAAGDQRLLGMFLRRLSIRTLRHETTTVAFDQDRWFLDGFSVAEAGWRWTNGPRAEILFATPKRGSRAHVLSVTASSLGRQRVEVSLRSPTGPPHAVTTWNFLGEGMQTLRVEVPRDALEEGAPAIVTFALPDARQADSDPRQLALAVREISLDHADDSVGPLASTRGVFDDDATKPVSSGR